MPPKQLNRSSFAHGLESLRDRWIPFGSLTFGGPAYSTYLVIFYSYTQLIARILILTRAADDFAQMRSRYSPALCIELVFDDSSDGIRFFRSTESERSKLCDSKTTVPMHSFFPERCSG